MFLIGASALLVFIIVMAAILIAAIIVLGVMMAWYLTKPVSVQREQEEFDDDGQIIEPRQDKQQTTRERKVKKETIKQRKVKKEATRQAVEAEQPAQPVEYGMGGHAAANRSNGEYGSKTDEYGSARASHSADEYGSRKSAHATDEYGSRKAAHSADEYGSKAHSDEYGSARASHSADEYGSRKSAHSADEYGSKSEDNGAKASRTFGGGIGDGITSSLHYAHVQGEEGTPYGAKKQAKLPNIEIELPKSDWGTKPLFERVSALPNAQKIIYERARYLLKSRLTNYTTDICEVFFNGESPAGRLIVYKGQILVFISLEMADINKERFHVKNVSNLSVSNGLPTLLLIRTMDQANGLDSLLDKITTT